MHINKGCYREDRFPISILCVELYNKSTELGLSKGIFIRAPQVEVPKQVQYIKSHKIMSDFYGEKRPLLAKEITHIFGLVFTNIMSIALTTGFGQVSKDKKISKCFFEGKDLASKKHAELATVLMNEGISIPSTHESFATDSTESPFSEKLMLIHTLMMAQTGISSMGMAIAQSARGDLQAKYVKFIAEIMNYTKHCTDILIDNVLRLL